MSAARIVPTELKVMGIHKEDASCTKPTLTAMQIAMSFIFLISFDIYCYLPLPYDAANPLSCVDGASAFAARNTEGALRIPRLPSRNQIRLAD